MNLAGNEDLDDDGVEVPREDKWRMLAWKLHRRRVFKKHPLFFPPVKGDESFQFGGKVFMTSSENEWCKEV